MSIFPESVLQEVREALDAEAVLRKIDYRPEMIQDAGQTLKCFCPIHRETIFRTLLVDKSTSSYRCSNYSCPGSGGGDLIDLYARSRGLGYEQGMLELASSFGVEVDLTVADQYVQNTLEVARNFVDLGVINEAEEAFASILRFKEDNIPALEGLIAIYEQTDRPDQFQATRLKLARVLAAGGKTAEAIDLLKVYTRDNPEDFDTRLFYIDCLNKADRRDWAAGEYVNLADDLASRGEIDRALEMYRAAQNLNAEGVDVSLHIIQLLVSAGRRDEAIAENLTEVEKRLGAHDPEGAVAALESAIQLDSSRESLYVRLCEIVAQARLTGEPFNRACEAVERLLAGRAHGPAGVALDALETIFMSRPRLMALRADLEEARENSERSLDLRLQVIDAYHQRREYDAALAVLDKTMHGRASNVTLLSRKANILREMGQIQAAIPVYLEIIELFRSADEYEHAAAVYQTVIDLEPEKLEHRSEQFELYLLLGMEPVITQKALALAEAFVARGQNEQATSILDRALRQVPHSPELLTRHGEIYEQWGRRGEAAEQFLAVGLIHLEQQNLDRARQVLERALKAVPEHLEAREALADVLAGQDMTLQAMSTYVDLAEFFLREHNPESVIRIARKILQIQPEHMPTLLMLTKAYGAAGMIDKQLSTQTRLVQLYLQGQSYTRATELCEEILASHEDYTPALEQLVAIAEANKVGTQSVRYLWKLSQVHARAGRREQEQGILEQILQKDTQHAAAWFRHLELLMQWATPRALANAVNQLIQHFEHGGRADEAIQILEDLRQTANPKPELFAGLARLYKGKGDTESLKAALRTQAELLGKLLRDDEALAVWNDLVALIPDDFAILRTRIEIMLRNNLNAEVALEYRRLATALANRGRPEEAQAALGEVLKQNPRDAAARDQLISLLIEARDFERAADQIEEAAARQMEEGQHLLAIHSYERIFEFDATRESIYRKIIAIRQRMGDIDGAVHDFQRLLDCHRAKSNWVDFEQAALEAIQLAPDHDLIRRGLAEFYVEQGRRAEAEQQFLTLANRQADQGRMDDAEATLDSLLTISPDSVPARALRAKLMAGRGKTSEALSEFMSLTGSFGHPTGLRGLTPLGSGSMDVDAVRGGSYEGIKLIREYTFETFIVGGRNNFAHATALAVSRAPAKNYNPLFLFSDVGLGKTHLCHAIAHYIRDRHPEFRIIYTTTEEFVAELIEAIQTNTIATFRSRHKLTDVLLVDDVQFLSGKERAQEEFFNIFNHVYQAGKQIVLTSDRPPKDIAHLEKRLKSRFGAGIIVDIQPPDLETRIAILRNELNARGKDGALSDEVLLFIAENIESNVRELKGALNQLLARQDFSGEKVDIVLTRQVLMRNYTEA